MSCNAVATLRPGYAAAHSMSGFAGIKLSAGLGASEEKQVGRPSRITHIFRVIERVLGTRKRGVQRNGSQCRPFSSLADDLACVPSDTGHTSTDDFQVVVHGSERPLKAGLRGEIYLIGREAIINACRHSGAKTIEIKVEYRPTELRIAVRDNGYGIDPRTLKWGKSGQSGLQSIRERAERIGARLRLRSGISLGTEVEVCVPGEIAF
jgi:light-regulated signal transduction histidine kinase (bacteriophytochrome)